MNRVGRSAARPDTPPTSRECGDSPPGLTDGARLPARFLHSGTDYLPQMPEFVVDSKRAWWTERSPTANQRERRVSGAPSDQPASRIVAF